MAEALTAAVDAFPVGAAPDWLIPDEIEHLPMLVKACRFGLTWALSSDLGADEGDEDDDDDLESGVGGVGGGGVAAAVAAILVSTVLARRRVW